MGVRSYYCIAPSASAAGSKKMPRSIAAGLIASLNPYFFLWWATAGAAIVAKAISWSWAIVALMFAVHISVDFIWYGIVGFTAAKSIRKGSRLQRMILVICGAAMIAFGIYFVRSAVKLLV